eukprot:Gregarina_sp_Poly_1__456@NODE_110_length_13975_cov_113_221887_g97_i0_p13_GENE_NODE_110_length_13975_cov_113_221887_g97_i0NODE_110_length_13975_cov_113_221887_g97_i0_p13_ORF_typecomplete_len122_score4_52K_channel_TID/PF07941_11/0_062_NODE_110_length_13975_cov_113_221887_g97_i08261191
MKWSGLLTASVSALFANQIKWPSTQENFNRGQLTARAFCFQNKDFQLCNAVCNYDQHWVDVSELDSVCNSRMPYGVPIHFSVRHSERNSVPWCWLNIDGVHKKSHIAVDLSTVSKPKPTST